MACASKAGEVPDTVAGMEVATVIFAAIAAVGSVLAVIVASKPFLRLVEEKHRQQDRIIADYREMFGRLYRFVMEDLGEDGLVKTANAQVFTKIADNVMYLHCRDEDEAWERYRQVHEI
jgi:hypothetical protein